MLSLRQTDLGRAALLVLALALVCSGAPAQSAPITVHVGVTCLSARELEAELEPGLVGALAQQALALDVEGSDEDPRSVRIQLRAEDGEVVAQRSFRPGPARCPDFHAAIAVIVGIMVRSLAAPAAAPAQLAPQLPSLPPPTLPPAPAPPPRIARADTTRPWTLAMRARGVLGFQLLGSRTGGVAAELELAARHSSVRAGVLATFSAVEHFEGLDAGYATRIRAATLDLCWRFVRAPRLLAGACLGALVGAAAARGIAGTDSRRVSAARYGWSGAQAGLEVALRVVGPAWALASLTAVHGLRELSLRADDGSAHPPATTLPRTGALLGLGLAYSLWSQGTPTSRHR